MLRSSSLKRERDLGMRHGETFDDLGDRVPTRSAPISRTSSRAGTALEESRSSTRVPGLVGAGSIGDSGAAFDLARPAMFGTVLAGGDRKGGRPRRSPAAKASPRKPNWLMWTRSSLGSFEVAWRSMARASSSWSMPWPSSVTGDPCGRRRAGLDIDAARAGIERILDQLLTTEAGRSTTSPAAIWLTRLGGSRQIGMGASLARRLGGCTWGMPTRVHERRGIWALAQGLG